MNHLTVVKIGGNVVDNPEALKRFIADFAALPSPKILIHGGGKEATRLSAALGIETTMIEGRRVTSRETLDVCTMVYAGLINKRITAMLQQAGCNAIGLSGADGKVIMSHRRSPEPIDYGYVGDIDRVDGSIIAGLLDRGLTPVFCAITLGADGSLLNTNADSVASAVATAMAAVMTTDLVFCFEKPGVLTDVNDPSSLIERIDADSFESLKADGTVADGMIPKIANALAAVRTGVKSVSLKHADNLLKNIATTIC